MFTSEFRVQLVPPWLVLNLVVKLLVIVPVFCSYHITHLTITSILDWAVKIELVLSQWSLTDCCIPGVLLKYAPPFVVVNLVLLQDPGLGIFPPWPPVTSNIVIASLYTVPG